MIKFIFRNSLWAIRKRPKINIPYTLFDLIAEIAGLVGILSMWIVFIVTYSGLPDLIPINYNFSGQAYNFGEKSVIIKVPVIATVLFVGMTILSRFPRIFNYPVIITENNAFFQYSNMVRMVRCLKLSLVLIFLFVVLQPVLYTGENIGIWFTFLLLAMCLIPLALVIYFMLKSFKYR